MSLVVGIDVVDAGYGLQRHGRPPFFQVSGLVQAVILQGLAHLVDAGVTNGEHAVIGLQHRTLGRVKHVAVYGPDQRPPDLHADFDVALLKITPFPIQLILVGIGRIDGELVNVNKIGIVDRVGPTQMLVVAVQHERRAGEEAARYVPALAALQHRLIPGGRPRIRLVGIDEKPRGSIGRARRGHGHGV